MGELLYTITLLLTIVAIINDSVYYIKLSIRGVLGENPEIPWRDKEGGLIPEN